MWYRLSGRGQREECSSAAAKLGITRRKPDWSASALSGGNQQRLMLAKWLLSKSAVLVAHEPTQAVGVGPCADLAHQ
jgi:ribose transport system ATP-binding protein